MGLEPITKKIPQNSGKQIRIPEGMVFNSLMSLESQNVGHWRKITKPLFSRCIYYISSIFAENRKKSEKSALNFMKQNLLTYEVKKW